MTRIPLGILVRWITRDHQHLSSLTVSAVLQSSHRHIRIYETQSQALVEGRDWLHEQLRRKHMSNTSLARHTPSWSRKIQPGLSIYGYSLVYTRIACCYQQARHSDIQYTVSHAIHSFAVLHTCLATGLRNFATNGMNHKS